MALSSRVKNPIVAKMNETLASIGNSTGMNMPKSTANNARVAWDYHVARHILRIAEKRRETTEVAAVKAGILPNRLEDPQPVGPVRIYHTSDHVITTVEVRKPSERVDVDDMIHFLATKGVDHALLREAKMVATKVFAPVHIFNTMWNEENGSAK